MADLIANLRDQLGEAHVLTDPQDTAPYLQDWRGVYRGEALAVVRPADVNQVAEVVRQCAAAAIPVIPQGGNTSLCGASVPSGNAPPGVMISLQRMTAIRAIDVQNNTITVESGCSLQTLRDRAEAAGRLFPLSLAAQGSCTVGGNLSTNAGGVNVLRYGNMRDQALGLEVVLADGRIWHGLRGLRKDNTGYDLKHLFIAAEGTLGIITAAVLKLYPAPRNRATAWLALPDATSAVALLGLLRREFGERVTGFELVGAPALELVIKHMPNARNPLAEAGAPWFVLAELTDTQEGLALHEHYEAVLGEALETGLILDASLASSIAQADALWALRENISEAQRLEGLSIKHDIAVPVSCIPEFIDQAGRALQNYFGQVRIVCFGHVGDGNLHYNLSASAPQQVPAFIARTAEANRIVHDLVAAFAGSISAEHGIGQLKRGELRHYKSALELELMQKIKDALDPQGIMNPGKVL